MCAFSLSLLLIKFEHNALDNSLPEKRPNVQYKSVFFLAKQGKTGYNVANVFLFD
jgi:hypothetical protein